MNASSHWIATRLAEPWEAPSFGAAGKLNKEVLETLLERWVGSTGALDPHVRLGLVVSVPFLRGPLREALAPELARLLQCASEDDDPWVRVMAAAVSGVTTSGRLDLGAVLADVPPVAETLAALSARLRDGVPARDFRPLEEACFSLKLRAAAGAAPPPPPDAHPHFTVRPAEAAPRPDAKTAAFARGTSAVAMPRSGSGLLAQQPPVGAPGGAMQGAMAPPSSMMGPPAPRRAVVVSGSGMLRAPPRPGISNAPLRPGAAALLRAGGGGSGVGEKRKLQCLDVGQISGLRMQESDEAIAKAVRASEAATEPTATAKKKQELLRQQMQEKERAKREAEKKRRDEEAAVKRKEQAAAEARILAAAQAQRAATLKAQAAAQAAQAAQALARAGGAGPSAANGAPAGAAGAPRPAAPSGLEGLALLAEAAPVSAAAATNVFANTMFAAVPPQPATAKPPAPAAAAGSNGHAKGHAGNGHGNGNGASHATLTMAQLPVYAGVPIALTRVAAPAPAQSCAQPHAASLGGVTPAAAPQTAVPPPRTTAT